MRAFFGVALVACLAVAVYGKSLTELNVLEEKILEEETRLLEALERGAGGGSIEVELPLECTADCPMELEIKHGKPKLECELEDGVTANVPLPNGCEVRCNGDEIEDPNGCFKCDEQDDVGEDISIPNVCGSTCTLVNGEFKWEKSPNALRPCLPRPKYFPRDCADDEDTTDCLCKFSKKKDKPACECINGDGTETITALDCTVECKDGEFKDNGCFAGVKVYRDELPTCNADTVVKEAEYPDGCSTNCICEWECDEDDNGVYKWKRDDDDNLPCNKFSLPKRPPPPPAATRNMKKKNILKELHKLEEEMRDLK